MDMQSQVGIGHRDARPLACSLTQLIYDGILHLVAHELRVTEILGEHDRIHGKRFVVAQILAPVNLLDFLIDLVGAMSFEMGDRLQDFNGRMQLEVGTIHQFLVASKRHHASPYLYIVGPQLSQLFCQDGLQSHECFGNELKVFIHFSKK